MCQQYHYLTVFIVKNKCVSFGDNINVTNALTAAAAAAAKEDHASRMNSVVDCMYILRP